MNDNTKKLYIKKRTFPEWLTCYIFLMPFLLSFLLDFLGLPSIIKYTIDLAWIGVFSVLFLKKRVSLERKIAPFTAFIGLFFLYLLIVYVFHFQSIFYYLWGFRKNFRFYVAFLAFALLFDEEDANSCLKFVDILFWINTVVVLFQFFVLDYAGDFLGGIFGVDTGCNGYSIVFFGLILCKSILMYMDEKEQLWLCFLKCGVVLLLSALMELKFFFILFALILLLATILTKFSWRKFILLLFSAGLMMLASLVLAEVFSSDFNLKNIFTLITNSTNYASAEDLGRFTAIPTISKTILTDFGDKLFGMGLGNCDTSAFAICNTPFFRLHEGLHYNWLSSAFWFLEAGYIGLTVYLSFFVVCLVYSIKQLRNGNRNPLFCQIAIIFSILCMALTFYNSSLRMEVGYFAYFALALPLITHQSKKEDGDEI